MKGRCHNPNNQAFANYGGRGITVCGAWKESFEAFLDDMESSFEPGLTLDRIDNDKGYSGENCRWATRREQAQNRRKTTDLPCGVFHQRSRYQAIISLGTFDTPEEASEAWQAAANLLRGKAKGKYA